MTKIKKPKTLFYDVETGLNKAFLFSLGEQTVRHNQLLDGFSINPIICLSYAIDNGTVKTLTYNINTGGCEQLIKDFDKLIESVDIVIGKNNARFDDKHVNTQRMLANLPGIEWLSKSDDLERQMRKYFYLPSQSLDYISKKLGLEGKVKMDFSDWVDIVKIQSVLQFESNYYDCTLSTSYFAAVAYCKTEYNQEYDEIIINGKRALAKMEFYNRKDVRDTRAIWNYCLKYFTPKFNMSAHKGIQACTKCGSTNIIKDGTRMSGKGKYQRYRCNHCGGSAGQILISQVGQNKPLNR